MYGGVALKTAVLSSSECASLGTQCGIPYLSLWNSAKHVRRLFSLHEFGSVFFGLLQYFGEGDGYTVTGLADVGGLHEGEDF